MTQLTDHAALAAIAQYERMARRHRARAELERNAGRPLTARKYDRRADQAEHAAWLEERNPEPDR